MGPAGTAATYYYYYYAAAALTDPRVTIRKHDKDKASKTHIFISSISSKHDKDKV